MSGERAAREWPVLWVWSALAGASVLGFAMAEGMTPVRVGATLSVILAAAKIHLVFDQYMELRWHHRPLRQLLTAWLAIVTAILLGGYWLS